MWPCLAGCPELDDPDRFADFLHEGTLLLNLLLRLNRKTGDDRTRERERLRGVFLERHGSCACFHGPVLDKLLCCLLADAGHIDLDASPLALSETIIREAIAALHVSMDEFGHVVGNTSPARQLFQPLQNVDSI